MEKDNDMRNIKKYVKKEMRNEQVYRDRFETANLIMHRHASQLIDKQVEGSMQ